MKIKTITLESEVIDKLVDTKGDKILKVLKEFFRDDIKEGEVLEFTIRVEKKYTAKEVEEMPEWDLTGVN